jgi:hypothetical protein
MVTGFLDTQIDWWHKITCDFVISLSVCQENLWLCHQSICVSRKPVTLLSVYLCVKKTCDFVISLSVSFTFLNATEELLVIGFLDTQIDWWQSHRFSCHTDRLMTKSQVFLTHRQTDEKVTGYLDTQIDWWQSHRFSCQTDRLMTKSQVFLTHRYFVISLSVCQDNLWLFHQSICVSRKPVTLSSVYLCVKKTCDFVICLSVCRLSWHTDRLMTKSQVFLTHR